MAKDRKPILCLDFDGVLHSYASGWQGADKVVDAPVPGAIDFLVEASEHFEVHIYSARSSQDGGIEAMRQWLLDYGLPPELFTGYFAKQELELQGRVPHDNPIRFPTEKPPAHLTIDDRAIRFVGVFPGMEELKTFKPWNKV